MLNKGRVQGATGILGSGNYFDFEHPLQSSFTLDDLAYGLAFEARWGGQTIRARHGGERVFFSVAQHCVIMCDHAPEELKYAALCHEAAEFMCGDVLGPFKQICPDFKAHEKRIEASMFHWLQVGPFDAVKLKAMDRRMMATERRDLTAWDGKDYWEYIGDTLPFDDEIVPVDCYTAALEFRSRFRQYAPYDVFRQLDPTPITEPAN